MTTVDDVLEVEGPAAPPRVNGELVFTAPWQSRLFGTTMRLFEAERFEWDQFRDLLISNIAEHEGELGDQETDSYDYWGCWQRSLEQLVVQLGLVSDSEITDTSAVLAARPPGHDHDHDHGDHDHGHSHGHDHQH